MERLTGNAVLRRQEDRRFIRIRRLARAVSKRMSTFVPGIRYSQRKRWCERLL